MTDVEASTPSGADEKISPLRYIPVTEAELEEEAQNYRRASFMGKMFCVLPKERYRVFLFGAMLCFISFSYSFLRVFKDKVVYGVLDNTDAKNWLKLLTFIVTQILVIVSQNLSAGSTFNVAFKKLMFFFTGLFAFTALLVALVPWLPLHDNHVEKIFVADSVTVRGLYWLYPLCIVLNQYVYSIFYIFAEVIGSLTVSFCFMTYMNNNTTAGQNKRFVKTVLFFSNISGLLSGFAYMGWNKYYDDKPKEDVDKYFIIFPLMVIGFYVVVLLVKRILERELLHPLVIPSGAPKKSDSKKKKIGLRESFYLMFSSKYLMSMCSMAFFYNFCSNIFDTANSAGMNASAIILADGKKSEYATGFKSGDLIFTSFATCIIIISPLDKVTDKYGIGMFASVPLIVCLLAAFVECYFALTNFPASGGVNMWPFHNYDSVNKYPRLESWVGTIIQSLIKIAKYAFYDIIKEALAMMLEPLIRPLYKGVFDGSITKLGKSMGSFYGIFMMSLTGSSDSRYYFPVSLVVIAVFCTLWTFPIIYLSRSYNAAKLAKTYMDPGMPTTEIKA